ncbi:Gfo/Idh/MocA family oxidoreductase [Chondrinema litorale]|uniref:Gfo/Idh/MocA family oxidoreductase n=1 Tax=Chondrinema litorale TaxID=2994555 RepID=UPI0025438A6F|nr:Gfo/Idh/MocA family oxidoreductase [Chondrinema litorale]UZR97247.1 Gfo/Idh/MocA family oxidoreductase [Chondrinema litorale]
MKMKEDKNSRRDFIKKSAIGAAGLGFGFSAKSYGKILGANDRIRTGIVGFSNRSRSLIPAFMQHASKLNYDMVAVSDIWNKRRDDCVGYMQDNFDTKIKAYRNNEELYDKGEVDAVIISTADFQHAMHCKQAVEAGCDAYVEKPFAETMDDAKAGLKAVEASDKIVQIGSQRRSGPNYHAANDFIRSGKFGDIVYVEMTWNVNQPGRWRRPDEVASLKESDVDWDRYLLNRPKIKFDPRKYLEYRLFWPYSSGIPGQWMSHQIDTVHWFSGYDHPRSVAANGGIYLWKDGRENFDTMTAVFDYGPMDDKSKGFQVVYSSRFTNSAGGTKEIYYSNAGELNLATNMVTPNGGLTERHATSMGLQANLLNEFSLSDVAPPETSADTGVDDTTSLHMFNWMDSVKDRKESHAPVRAGYNHSIANIMTTAALRTGEFVTFDEAKQEVLAGGKVFKY